MSKLTEHLIDEWKDAWKFWSVQLNTIGLVIMGAVEILRDGLSMVPSSLAHLVPYAQWVAIGFFILGLIARLFRQKKPETESKTETKS